GLAQGYINQPELTRDKFVPNPFADTGHLLYRTGDIVRYLPDGNIEFIVRADGQVKIRGFRIEPGEVEVVLKRHPAVEDAVVTAREDEPGERRLAAYIVLQNGDPTGDWRGFLQERFPDYMIPSAFVILDKLPLTPNGKVDRHALPAPERQLESYRAPRSPQEEILCGIFAEVLKLERVGIEDNFFALGGHSLLAIQLVNRTRETLGVELDVRTIFEMPVVSELASCLGKSAMAQSPIVRHQRPPRLPLSNVQERLWFLDRLEGSSFEYNMAETVRLRGKLNLPALDRAINTLIERHESLRTRFGETDGEPFQIIEPACHIPLEIEDLSVLENGMRETAITAALCRESEKYFDLSSGPLFRIKLLRLGECDHILLWTCHHIINDGWSITIFNREIGVLYEAFREERQSPLSPLPLQYADYALWQRNQLRSEESQALLAYWRTQLADAPTLELPTDRPRPPRRTTNGARCSVFLPRDLTSGLEVLSREENCTLFMSLLAAFKLLLSRHSGQEDISLGIPAVNRSRVEIEGLIGCFLNTLVLRTNLSGNITFRELMRRVRKVTLGAYANSDLPFEKLVEELQPERSLSYSPLFQVFLNFISIEDEAFILPGLEAEKIEQESLKAKFDLTLYAYEREESLFLVLVYNTDLFEAATAERMLGRFQVLLEAIVANPDQYVGALSLLTPDDQRTYTVSDNRVRPRNPYVHFPLDAIEQSIGTRFEEQVRMHSMQTAVKTLAHEWTYAELDHRANIIAREILRICPEGENRVALLLEHDAPMVAAVLGSLKAGKTYVALSPSHPRERLAKILTDSGARALLTDASNRILARELAVGETALIGLDDLGDDADSAQPDVAVSPRSLAYLLYTSGSTGEPKAVAQNHHNVLHHIRNYTNSLHISRGDRMLLLASYGYDAAVMDIFGALLNGATLLPFDIRKHDFNALGEWIAAEEATIYHSTPTVFRHFFRTLPKDRALPRLRLVVMGGERVLSQDIELFKERFSSGCILVNGFGQTEYSFALQYFTDSMIEFQGHSMPIGYPVDETEVFLLNAEGHPDQVFGEIAVRSPYLARGYWRCPELTATAFKEDPRGGNLRTYRTGDLGRLRVDGTIEFAGRKDFQVKIRGNRIELGEIEAVLRRHSQIESTVVVTTHYAENEQELIAYVVLKKDGSASPNRLRDFLAQSLPDYMVPSTFVILKEMPLTPNGKINRKALPLPEFELSAQEHVPPRTLFEKTLAEIWREVLRVDTIGIRDDFFQQGGHSLVATRLVSQMREKFDVEIPIRAVFERRTIENLALYIAELQASEAVPDEIEKLLEELESLP
ncbi:MAG TPA: amino acid adenylation domain-containing protein, partial [Terrimicrobiaceae bacterium]